jgi:membrane associated rhomboid family serine protease
MTTLPDSPANYCYRHPNRQSFVLCQRCGRTICPECQTQAAVGVHCPECVRESRSSMPSTRPAVVTAIRSGVRATDAPVVTYGIIALCVVVFIVEVLTGTSLLGNGGGSLYGQLAYAPVFTVVQPWRIVTTLFTHASLIHIAFNMFSLFILGRQLEPMVGRVRFALLFLLSGIGGSVGVLLVAPNYAVVGASGAIFGLFGAYFVIARHLGANATQIIIVIAINLGIGFIVPGIAWQAHVGGLLIGALVGFVFVRTRSRQRRPVQVVLVIGVAALLVILIIVGVAVHGVPTSYSG